MLPCCTSDLKRRELKSFRQEFNDFRDETRQNFREIRAELADIRRDVEELKSRADNSAGYSKEIDHALERIAAIEKHLGIEKNHETFAENHAIIAASAVRKLARPGRALVTTPA